MNGWQKAWRRFTGKAATTTQIDALNYRSSGRSPIEWSANQASADQALRYSIQDARNKSRVLEQYNPIAERIFHLWEANTLSATGMMLQMQIKQEQPITLQGGEIIPAGAPDEGANKAHEDAWYEFWHTSGACDVSGELCGPDKEKLILRTAARDGFPLIRLIRGFDNPWKFTTQLIEVDQLDLNYNEVLPNGNEVRMSVEVDKWGRRVAYWISKYHAGDWERGATGYSYRGTDRIRIPAEGYQTGADDVSRGTILCPVRKRRPGQTLDWPWLTPVIDVLNCLGKAEEAELIATRAEAEKGGYFEKTNIAEDYTGAKDGDGNFVMQSIPGMIEALPVGWSFKERNPTHPNGNFGEFRKWLIRSIASGVGMSYGAVANDRSDSSFSAERTALNDEREQYKMLQAWFAASVMVPIFNAWQEMALLSKKITLANGSVLPVSRYDKFNKPYFQGRRWGWINPAQDISAAILAVQHGFDSRRSVIAGNGKWIEDVDAENRLDKLSADQNGMVYGVLAAPKAPDGAGADIEQSPQPPAKPVVD